MKKFGVARRKRKIENVLIADTPVAWIIADEATGITVRFLNTIPVLSGHQIKIQNMTLPETRKLVDQILDVGFR